MPPRSAMVGNKTESQSASHYDMMPLLPGRILFIGRLVGLQACKHAEMQVFFLR